jgi:hypothetical protein
MLMVKLRGGSGCFIVKLLLNIYDSSVNGLLFAIIYIFLLLTFVGTASPIFKELLGSVLFVLLALLALGFILSQVERAHESALTYGNPLHFLPTLKVNYLISVSFVVLVPLRLPGTILLIWNLIVYVSIIFKIV